MASPMYPDVKGFKEGDQIMFWSDRVFGVPVRATVTKVGRKLLHAEAWFGLAEWKTTIHPHRVCGFVDTTAPWWVSGGDAAVEADLARNYEDAD